MRSDNLTVPKKFKRKRPRFIDDCHETRKGEGNLDGLKWIIAFDFYHRLQENAVG